MSSQKSPTWLRGLSYGLGLVLGGVIVILNSVFSPSDQSAQLISWSLGGVCILIGGWKLWKWWHGDCVSQPISLPEEVHMLPVDHQIAYLQRIMKMSLVAFPLLTLYITFELTRLERGKVDSVMLWAPIILIYEALGYWPAICAIPGLGIACFFALNRRLKQLDAEIDKQTHLDDITRGRSR
jgi:MFS family permease